MLPRVGSAVNRTPFPFARCAAADRPRGEAHAVPYAEPSMPPIPGLVVRGFRGAGDRAGLVHLLNDVWSADGVEARCTLESVDRHYAHLVNCDPSEDQIFAEMNGELVGFGEVSWKEEPSRHVLLCHVGNVAPVLRRRGLGRAILQWNERRLRHIVRSRALPSAICRFQAVCRETVAGARNLFHFEGYEIARTSHLMTRALAPLPALRPPPGFETRPLDTEWERPAWEGMVEAFRDMWGFAETSERNYLEWKGDPNRDAGLCRIALVAGTHSIAGGAFNTIDAEENRHFSRRRGFTTHLFVRRAWRRRGLGRLLLAESLDALAARGMTEAALGVDALGDLGALDLYTAMGYRKNDSYLVYRKRFGA